MHIRFYQLFIYNKGVPGGEADVASGTGAVRVFGRGVSGGAGKYSGSTERFVSVILFDPGN